MKLNASAEASDDVGKFDGADRCTVYLWCGMWDVCAPTGFLAWKGLHKMLFFFFFYLNHSLS